MGQVYVGNDVPSVKDKKAKSGNIHIGVFFDGTSNSYYNTDYRKENPNKDYSDGLNYAYDSYRGDYTNITKLYKTYKTQGNDFKIYIEGPGTDPPSSYIDKYGNEIFYSTGVSDSLLSAALGQFTHGMREKQNKAEKLIIEKLKTKIGQGSNLNLKLDVFGFSRGAAIARSFIQPWNIGTLQHKIKKDYEIECHIDIHFLGLFDTVLSNFISGYDLRLLQNIKKVVHLVAANEYRQYFPVTSIKEKNKKLRSNYIEIVLPGSHSDIGGGYNQDEIEHLYYFNPNKHVEEREKWPSAYDLTDENSIKFQGYMSLQLLHKNHWINDVQYEYAYKKYLRHLSLYSDNHTLYRAVRCFYPHTPLSIENIKNETRELIGFIPPSKPPYRIIKNDFARIPYTIMYNLTQGVIPNSYFNLRKFEDYSKLTPPPAITKKSNDDVRFLAKSLNTLASLKEVMIALADRGEGFFEIVDDHITFKKRYKGLIESQLYFIRPKFIHLSAHDSTGMKPHDNDSKNAKCKYLYHREVIYD
ncbi:T6SS phospholipase effector Tle1-like catalytic domain-containing protein [Prevotella denticola]|uniref:T6SS phospholipase effector Tle1-like catalytic domain-containing protein n=1 Tax=Prevotella denticola TaxID=28129 RepID=UPI000E5798A0|nr:DUF2235 domain-containing protein [Prevotella denticola]AXV49778.1 DUF2235 domain-containing protein [Prevotella denticola]